MSVRNFATGIWNGIKKGPTHHTDGYFAAAGYGLSDGSMDHTINGGIFGAAGGLIHRQGLSGFAKGFSKGIRSIGGVEGELDSFSNYVIDLMPLGMDKMFRMDSAKDGAVFGAAAIGVGGH